MLMQPSSLPADGVARTTKTTFSRITSVSTKIQADAAVVWALLTNAEDFPRWNSTVLSLQGDIRQGEKIELKSTLDPSRTFKLKVKQFIPEQTMIWGDQMGERTYTIKPSGEGLVFSMTEKIGGIIFPLFANKIPSFDASFEAFAADLKKEAEIIAAAR